MVRIEAPDIWYIYNFSGLSELPTIISRLIKQLIKDELLGSEEVIELD